MDSPANVVGGGDLRGGDGVEQEAVIERQRREAVRVRCEGDQTDEVVRTALESIGAADEIPHDGLDGLEPADRPAAPLEILGEHAAGAVDDELDRDALGEHAGLLVGLAGSGYADDEQSDRSSAKRGNQPPEPRRPGSSRRDQRPDRGKAHGTSEAPAA